MRLTVSLPESEAEFLRRYQEQHQMASRSAVVAQALKVLREASLVEQYRQADDEWHESGEARVWEATAGEGIEAVDETW